ncbi:succinate dehydrogenase assembly factor 2 [Formosimonas limnophila]|uniref:FAD assembly factor SdhE n=1 Tax=Formosimonas limnophila TaxID=1384487 RepID=A0A8J3CK28_9BURK|nr:succinate dehydrogenase assembly factor 2 [Formosimonas limnophila]GHA67588.1 succinate dehydrogenase assembly factor 2 [Formosimonas limnophila]
MSVNTEIISDEKRRVRLRWRAKRGLLENDIIMTRFFEQHEARLTDDEVYGLDLLLDLPDDELFALLMNRKALAEVDPSEHTMTSDDMRLAEHVLDFLKSV